MLLPTLYEWEIKKNEVGLYYIEGRILHSPPFKDGDVVYTAPLRSIDFVDGVADTDEFEYMLV